MSPVHPPVKNDGPACRVCGCTENNACVDHVEYDRPGFGRKGRAIMCRWVKVEARSLPLCSACSGTLGDAVEVVRRVEALILISKGATRMAKSAAGAFIERHEAFKKQVASVPK